MDSIEDRYAENIAEFFLVAIDEFSMLMSHSNTRELEPLVREYLRGGPLSSSFTYVPKSKSTSVEYQREVLVPAAEHIFSELRISAIQGLWPR